MGEYQTSIVRLPSNVGRRAGRWIESHPDRYDDLSEFVTVAIENQLALESVDHKEADHPRSIAAGVGADLDSDWDEALVAAPTPGGEIPTADARPTGLPLGFLTNRLNPMALVARVLLNQVASNGNPSYDEFVDSACRVARAIGRRLESEDRAAGAAQCERRFTGWPVGADRVKARARFSSAFLLHRPGDDWQGPLAELGLAVLEGNRVHLTALGLDLGRAPSAVLGEVDGHVLGRSQQEILRRALMVARGERAAIAAFLQAVTDAEGHQPEVDRRLRAVNPGWTQNRAVAHRAAMVGRLRDVGVVSIIGRGPTATISVVPGTVRR